MTGTQISRLAMIVALMAAGTAPAAEVHQPGDEIQQVLAEKLPNVPGKTISAITVHYAPGGKSGAHQHSGSVFAYVLSGSIRSENSATGPARVYKAGEGFFEPEGSIHLVSENASATEPASLLAVFVADNGATLTTFNAAPAVSQTKSTPAELVDALNLVFGKQTTNRAVHAKGIVLEGKFTPSHEAMGLSKAAHFQNTAVPVTVRFSNFAGVATVSDTDGLANPRGLALKFHLPDGSETDLVTHSFNGFPSATADEFRELLTALGTSGPDSPKPTPAEKYLGTHPIAKTFLESQQPAPVSYATLTYFGVNSFKFTNAAGKVTYGRYRIEPQAGNHFLSAADIAKADPGYLAAEITKRVAAAPVRFNFRVQLAEAGDKIDDPSIAWPDSRKVVDLGVIEITKAVADSDAAERALIFLPAKLPSGIEPADPMIQARQGAYPVSYQRRHQ